MKFEVLNHTMVFEVITPLSLEGRNLLEEDNASNFRLEVSQVWENGWLCGRGTRRNVSQGKGMAHQRHWWGGGERMPHGTLVLKM